LLPASVSVTCMLPAAVTVGVPQVAARPVGSPVTRKLDPVALELGCIPPIGIIVTVTACEAVDFILIAAGDSASEIAGAGVTCTLAAVDAVSPSPVAVILRLVVANAALVAALRVSVEVVVPSAVDTYEPSVQVAETPVGNPLTASETVPVNEPSVVVVTCNELAAP